MDRGDKRSSGSDVPTSSELGTQCPKPGDGRAVLDSYRDVLLPTTAEAWRRLAPATASWMYLAGGTALATHLRHRTSRDLDLFTEQPFDAAQHADMLIGTFPDFVPTDISEGTVNGVLGETKVQFLDASPQHRLVEAPLLAGIRVAGVEDILAMKIKVVMDRGELRDYFDLMCVEQQTDLDVAEGMTLYLERYRPTTPEQHILQAVRALGYFDDVPDDPGLPVRRSEIEQYWTARQPRIIKELNLD